MILLVDCNTRTAKEMAERIRNRVERNKFHIPGHSISMTLSIGTAIFPIQPDQDIWDSFKAADIALYRAKENGRNQVVHYSGPGDEIRQLSPPESEGNSDET